jgi:predicted RNA-binding protein with PIN domain
LPYLVDGNNVMGQRVGWHRDRAGARRRLLGELARFARGEGTPVAVVFDGAPDPAVPDDACVDGVHVYYAAPGTDADTRITRLVAAAAVSAKPTVVTSDRRLAATVQALGARVIRAGVLRRHLDALGAGDGG